MQWLLDTVEAARQATLLLVRSRLLLLVVAGCVAGAVGFWFVARQAAPEVPGDEFFGCVVYFVFFLVGIPFSVLYFAISAVHREIEDRSVTFLFVRPVHRSSLLVGKWLAVAGVGSAMAAFAITLLYAPLALSDLPWTRGLRPPPEMLPVLIVAAVMAVAAYAAVGVCFGAAFRRPLITGVAFVIGWEMLVSHTPPEAGVRGLTVVDPVRRWMLLRLQPRGELYDILAGDLDPSWVSLDRLGDPLGSLGCFTAVILALAIWVYGRREYESRPRE